MVSHPTFDELTSGLSKIQQSPMNQGVLKAIVIRPVSDERKSLKTCEISPEFGVHGDHWARGCWKSLPNGRPDPDVQVAIINSRAIQLVASGEHRWPLAGDNLYVDLQLSKKNLQAGQRLLLGSAILEITEVIHNGCQKFAQRFGADALTFVNSELGKTLRLRGIYAKVVQRGIIHVGDVIKKTQGTTKVPYNTIPSCQF